MLSIDSWIRFALTEAYAVGLLALVFRKPMLEFRKNVWLRILLVMLALYMAQLFYVLLSPTYFFRRFSFSAERVNLIPFRVLNEWLAHPFNFFGNVLLFMPVGFFEVLLYPSRSRGLQLGLSAAVAALLSLLVEFAQCFNYRVPDVDDVILNTLGSVIGALLCMLLQKAGFDRTGVGRVLMPKIPMNWRRHMLLNRFCLILAASMELVLFAVNYIVTVPKPQVYEYGAVPAALETVAEPAEEEDAADTPEDTGREAVAAAPEPETYNTERLELEARSALLVRLADEPENDRTVFAVAGDRLIYPASTLKMLTALTVLEIAEPEEKVCLGTEIYIPPLDASRAGLEYGMTLSVRDLLEGLLLPSGADAAYALGVYCGRKLEGNGSLSYGEAVGSFVKAMNRKAAALGAEHTKAVNVVGLDDAGQLTTAEDIVRIAREFLDQPLLAEICSLPSDTIVCEKGKRISLSNTNKMLHSDSVYYNSAVAGVKTGTTSRAGNCLVSVFTVRDERYLCVVMNSSYYGKFTDTQKLFEVCAGER